MNGIRRLIIILFLLSTMAALTYSQAPVRLNGSEGMALLQSLTKGATGMNNTSLNETNNSTNLTMPRNVPSSLDSWGTKPKDPPLRNSQSGDDYLNDSINGNSV
jgi:hypothetical protein